MQRSSLCRSRRELSNEYLFAKFGFDTAENEPCKVCPLSAYRSPRYPAPRGHSEDSPRRATEPSAPPQRPRSAMPRARSAGRTPAQRNARGSPPRPASAPPRPASAPPPQRKVRPGNSSGALCLALSASGFNTTRWVLRERERLEALEQGKKMRASIRSIDEIRNLRFTSPRPSLMKTT